MILKVLPVKSNPARLINYILNDKDRIRNEASGGFIMTHNLQGQNSKEWIQEYLANESKRLYKRSGTNVVTHEILSFAPEDLELITPEILKDITQKYIELRGEQGIYMAAPHFNKEHLHIHLCTSGLELESGLSMRISRAELSKLKSTLQEYQQREYPFLTNSVVQHGRKAERELAEREYQLVKRTGKQSRKQRLLEKVKEQMASVKTLTELKQAMELAGVKMYERGGKLYGFEFEGKNMRFGTLGLAEEIGQLQRNELIIDSRQQELESIEANRDQQVEKTLEKPIKGYDILEMVSDIAAENMVEYEDQWEKDSRPGEVLDSDTIDAEG